MPAYDARAIVLRRTKLGETDTIVTFLAEDGTQIRAVAKGLRKPTSKFGGRLEPGAEIDLLLHKGKNLDIVSEVRTVDAHAALRQDFDRQAAACVVEDVIDGLTRDAEPDSRLFGLVRATLAAMEDAPAGRLLDLVLAFLLKAMAMHGYRPELQVCAACAGELNGSEAFSLPAGGAVCARCGTEAPGLHRLSSAGRAWLELLLSARMSEVAGLEMPRQAAMDGFDLIRAFVAYHLPTRLRALDFYATTVSSVGEEMP
jgi:DNA repair protein RecO (recombination protein O)